MLFSNNKFFPSSCYVVICYPFLVSLFWQVIIRWIKLTQFTLITGLRLTHYNITQTREWSINSKNKISPKKINEKSVTVILKIYCLLWKNVVGIVFLLFLFPIFEHFTNSIPAVMLMTFFYRFLRLRLTQKELQLPFWFFFFFPSRHFFWTDYQKLFSQRFYHKLSRKRVTKIWLIPWTLYLKSFRKNCSPSCYLWRVWNMTHVAHDVCGTWRVRHVWDHY